MPFDFPAAPVADEVYTHAPSGLSYVWDGFMWKPGASTVTTPNPYVAKAGDSMLGPLALVDPDPVDPLHAAHRKYVDRIVAEQTLYQGTWSVAANTPDLDPAVALPLNGYAWTAQTVDPAIPEVAPVGIPGIEGNAVSALDTIKWNEALLAYEHIRGPTALSQMTIADVPPPAGFHGQQWWDSDSGKNYVYYIDPSGDGYWVQTSGGGGASKAEVYFGDVPPDPTFDGELWWDTTTGNLMINYGGTFVQTNVEEAPVDGTGYVRQDAGWVNSVAASLPPAATTPVVFEANWSGSLDFRTNATMVTVRLHNVKNSGALTGAPQDVKICNYPAGVTAPWADLTSTDIRVCTDDSYTPSTRHAMVRAKADGIYITLYAGAAAEDLVANDRITCSLSWAI